jgi:hypothetical protein
MYRFDCLVDAYYVIRRRPDVLLITGYLSVIATCEVSERRLCVGRSTDPAICAAFTMCLAIMVGFPKHRALFLHPRVGFIACWYSPATS